MRTPKSHVYKYQSTAALIEQRVWLPKEVAAHAQLSLSRIKVLIYEGQITAYKTLGGHWRVLNHHAQKFFRERGITSDRTVST